MKEKEKIKNYGKLNYGILSIVTAIMYFSTARLSLLLAAGSSNATSIWPPSGIAVAVIFLWGYRMGPAIFFGAFISNLLFFKTGDYTSAYMVTASLTTAAGNMLEGIIGVYFIRRFSTSDNPFDTMKDLFIFIIFGSLVSTLVSSTFGVGSYCLITGKWLSFSELWLTWWLGDAAGILIVSPIIILFKKNIPGPITGISHFEEVIVFLILTVTSLVIFHNNYQVQYLIIPLLLWIAFRFGRAHSALAVFLVSAIAVICTVNGADSAGGHVSHKMLLLLQTYIGVISITTLCLSVLAYERSISDKSRFEAQKQLYDIIELLPDPTFAIDGDGKVITWNRAIEVLTGIPKKDMIGKTDYEYSIPFFGERCPILIDLAMKNCEPVHNGTYEYLDKKGLTLFAEMYNPILNCYLAGAASSLIDSEGKIYGAIETIRDISDRKTAEHELKHYRDHLEEIVKERSAELVRTNEQLIMRIENQERAEKALAEGEKKYRDLVESVNSIIIRWKPDGTITFFNTYAQKFFGFSELEIVGRNIIGIIVPVMDTSGKDLELLMKDIVCNPDSHVLNENENIRKNGERAWIAWTNKPIFNESGSVEEILSVGNDLTSRKNMEESLRKMLNELAQAKERAELADRIKSAFLATMSHELRTPLNSIIGFTGVILQGLAGPLNEEQKKQMGMVRGSAQHLLSLINDVLDISKIEAGQFEVYTTSFDLRSVINKAAAALTPAAEKKGVSLHIQIGDAINEAVSDERRVEQVLLNLLSNAIKFTEHGSVSLFADIINDYMPGKSDKEIKPYTAVEFKIEDTGIGIRHEDMSKLFHPFQQIDTGLARMNEGTGLGLAISMRLSELLGGEIKAESEWGRGSVFTFIIPLDKRTIQ